MNYTDKVKAIKRLKPGPELDRRVSKAIGWKCHEKCDADTCQHLPDWSRSYYAAFVLRIEMGKLGWESEDRFTNTGWGDDGSPFGYQVWFRRWERPFNGVEYVAEDGDRPGRDTMALVTVRAALCALEEYEACRVGPSKEKVEEIRKVIAAERAAK